jgi:hypothetical protein
MLVIISSLCFEAAVIVMKGLAVIYCFVFAAQSPDLHG